jgi:hypothetical protein
LILALTIRRFNFVAERSTELCWVETADGERYAPDDNKEGLAEAVLQ